MITFTIEPKQQIQFFEMINHEFPTEIKGLYFVGNGDDNWVDCIVRDPSKKILFKRTAEKEGIMSFLTTVPGQYQFVFSNLGDRRNYKDVTFALNTFEDIAEPDNFDQIIDAYDNAGQDVFLDVAEKFDIDDVMSKFKAAIKDSKNMLAEIKLSLERQHGHNRDVIDNDQWYWYSLLIETILFLLILYGMRIHLRSQINNKPLGF